MLAVALLTYAAFRVAPLPQHLSEGFAQSVYTLLLVLAAAATALATARSEGYERGFWGRFTIMLVALTLAQLMWTWSAFRLPGFPVDVFAFDMVAEIVAMGVFISLVWTMTDVADGTTLGKLRYFIDVVAAALIAGVLLYTVVIYPWFASYGTSGWITVGYALYPVFGILVGLWTLSNLFGFRPSGWTSWERPAVAGLILFATGAFTFPITFVSVAYASDPALIAFVEVQLMVGSYLFGVAALYRMTSPARPWPLRPMPPVTSRHPVASSIIPAAVALVGLCMLAVVAFLYPTGSSPRLVLVGSALVVAGLIAVRTGLSTERAGRLRVAAGLDPLTGLRNHRGFHERLAEACRRAKSDGETLSVIVVDLDDFDHVNRVFGYAEGDRLLIAAARVAAAAGERDEVVSRLGGDEFGLLLRGADSAWARMVADVLLAGVRSISDPSGAPMRASAGIGSYPGAARSYGDVMEAADQALLNAKLSGKDRAVLWSAPAAEELDEEEIERRALSQSYLATLRTTAAAVDARLPGGAEHSRRVGSMATRLALRAGFDQDAARRIETAGLLHDVGKVGVPDAALLDESGSLSPVLRERYREHAAVGETIVGSAGMTDVATWVGAHHECWDGSGFPNGLAGEDIPLEARIVAVADSYDRVANRVADSGLVPTRGEVAAAMRSGMGTSWDPVVVLHLYSLLAEDGEQ